MNGVGADAKAPTWAEVTQAHVRLRGLIFGQLRAGNWCYAAWRGRLRLRQDGTIGAFTVTEGQNFVGAFLIHATELLRAQSTRGVRLRFCKHCRHPFPSKRPDAEFCPGTSCRTLAWRKADPERFKRMRKRAYKRASERRLGLT